ncbi:tRNA1Val (adenine37-N6)-methyltransferase [Desulfonatronum thiosulfatophilum]|uniref:tRNA1Val (Adenine37-N6)-methyltransferase n=1 Tax=Desulfonatronum thiosulfatophilum TaxID=617002 RepID=A0A1G6A7Z4_9BACT|nr:methyltransferase [Desulfonatronum thiosulfatophilum]SDB04163.1 tRNA1Val (adenine37-N6)-methyltransferase [Desulfonatronum thiosulfatophilum]
MRQPENGFRFSVDALLLACFAAGRLPERVADLGTGCGVISLGLLLHYPEHDFQITGLDINPDMISAAGANARNLGFADRFTSVHGDVRNLADISRLQTNDCDLVLCNPPYRLLGQGRTPSAPAKCLAKFETDGRLEDFVRGASRILKTRGRLCMVHLPEHANRVLQVLNAHRLEPKRLCLVHPYKDKPASLLLLEARKGGNPGLSVEPPLILYARGESPAGQVNHATPEAISFCPFLRCNSSRAIHLAS